jgi:predicted AAA+ superfamily ATPase
MDVSRPNYLKQLADAMGNGMVKIVTGIRRYGKSHLQHTAMLV